MVFLNPFTVVDEITCSVRRYYALVMYVGLNYYIWCSIWIAGYLTWEIFLKWQMHSVQIGYSRECLQIL